MRERERIVKVERINNIRIRQRPELAEAVYPSPVGPGRDDSMLWSRLANCGDDPLLKGEPIGFASAEHGPVYHVNEEQCGTKVPQLTAKRSAHCVRSPD